MKYTICYASIYSTEVLIKYISFATATGSEAFSTVELNPGSSNYYSEVLEYYAMVICSSYIYT